MPNTKQAQKRLRQNERARQANKAQSTAMKTAMKKVLNAESADEARAAMPEAVRLIDKCAKSNVIHDNAAARQKSRLAKHVNGL